MAVRQKCSAIVQCSLLSCRDQLPPPLPNSPSFRLRPADHKVPGSSSSRSYKIICAILHSSFYLQNGGGVNEPLMLQSAHSRLVHLYPKGLRFDPIGSVAR